MLPLYPLGTIIQDHIVAVVIVPFGQEELCGVANHLSAWWSYLRRKLNPRLMRFYYAVDYGYIRPRSDDEVS